jgi:hypothetical protein
MLPLQKLESTVVALTSAIRDTSAKKHICAFGATANRRLPHPLFYNWLAASAEAHVIRL